MVYVVELKTANEALVSWQFAGKEMVADLSKVLGLEARTATPKDLSRSALPHRIVV